MAIVKESVPYEYMARFNADGTVRGQHIKYLERVYDEDTGEVYAEREGDALSVGDARATVMLGTALGEVNAAMAKAEEIERNKRLSAESERDAERKAKETAIAERDAEREAKRQLEQAVLAERAEKAKIAEQLEKAHAERDQLLQQPPRQNDPGNAG